MDKKTADYITALVRDRGSLKSLKKIIKNGYTFSVFLPDTEIGKMALDSAFEEAIRKIDEEIGKI